MQFGELALINDDKRAATVTTDTSTFLGYLERDEYKEVLKKAH